MQNTQHQTTSAEYVINLVWDFMNHARGQVSSNDIFPLILAFLYSYHKGYPIHVIDDRQFEFPQNDDNLLHDLVMCIPSNLNMRAHVHEFCQELALIGRDEFNTVYPDVLKGLFNLISSNAGRSSGEFYTPSEVTKLMAYFVKKEGCSSVFDPFCGTASIIHEFNDNANKIYFTGQEFSQKTSLFARLSLEAYYGDDFSDRITLCNSISCWNTSYCEAIVSFPPIGLKLPQKGIEDLLHLQSFFPCRSIDALMLTAPFYVNKAKLAATLTSTGFCFRGGYDYELRKHLIDNNLLDAVIALPSNILYGTSIPSVMIICKRFRNEDEPIKFYHADDYFISAGRMRTFDYERFIAMAEGGAGDCVEVSLDEIAKYDYNLNPSLYYKMDYDIKEGQQVKRIYELLEPVEGERISARDVTEMVSIGNLSKDFIHVLLNNGKHSPTPESRRDSSCRVFKDSESKYLLTINYAGESRYGINTDGNVFNCSADIKVYKVNESLVSPEYIAYTLINNDAISKGRMPLSGYMMHPIVIESPSAQKEIVNKIVQQYDQKVTAEREADAKRLGVQTNISDMAHMISRPIQKVSIDLDALENLSDGNSDMLSKIKSLKDNFGYMERVIRFANSDFSESLFDLREKNISSFIQSYIDGWRNYGGNYFTLSYDENIQEDLNAKIDETLMMVLFDAVLDNATRHGFNKRKDIDNKVEISLSLEEYEEKAYAVIRIANNGESIADGFSLEDYISRGRYSASTGRSGLGGYHTYKITKGHNGFLFIDSTSFWNCIVEVLIPITSNNKPQKDYENECI